MSTVETGNHGSWIVNSLFDCVWWHFLIKHEATKLKRQREPDPSQTCQLVYVVLCDFWAERGFELEETRILSHLTAVCGWQSEKVLELGTDIQQCVCCVSTGWVDMQHRDDVCNSACALSIVAPERNTPSLSLAVCMQPVLDGLWSERADALQTRSHTLCLRATRKQAEKKRAFLCTLIECTLIYPSVSSSALPSTSQIRFCLHINAE